MTTDYATHLATKCEQWRERYPNRAVELSRVVRRMLGISPSNESEFAKRATVEAEQPIIRAVMGWPNEDDWSPTA